MKEIPLVGKHGAGLVALVDDEDYDRVSEHRWFLWKGNRYVGTNLKVDGRWRQTSLHRFVTRTTDPKTYVDHRDHNKLNNQKYNLRVCRPKDNSRNRRATRGGSSSYHGVHKDPAGYWRVRIKKDEHLLHVGNFDNEIDAARAYDFYALRYFGEFANPNFPEFDYAQYEVASRPGSKPRKRPLP